MTSPGGARNIRALAMLVVGLALLVVAVPVYRNGIASNDLHWPDDATVVPIDRYNGAWIAGSFGLAILGAMLLVVALATLVRARGRAAVLEQ